MKNSNIESHLNGIRSEINEIQQQARVQALDELNAQVMERIEKIERLLDNKIGYETAKGDRWRKIYDKRHELYMKKWELYEVQKMIYHMIY